MSTTVKWKEGDRVRVITRLVTEEDRKKNRYFDHMAGLVGTIQAAYSDDEISIKVDPESLSPVTAEVRKIATQRMRDNFVGDLSEEQRRTLTKEELEFTCHYVVLVQASDIEPE